MSNWVILGEYLDKEVLVQTKAILNGNKISFRVKTPETHLNSALGQATSQPFIIEVLSDEYELAKQLIHTQDENASVVEVPMNEYTSEELKEIVLNPEDWHQEFIAKAKEELAKRGTGVSEGEVEKTREEKIKQFEKGTEPSKTIYYFMWFFSLMGGYIGIIAGYFYWKGKIKGIDGRRYYMYSEKYRNRGYYMFILGSISAFLQTFLYIKFT